MIRDFFHPVKQKCPKRQEPFLRRTGTCLNVDSRAHAQKICKILLLHWFK